MEITRRHCLPSLWISPNRYLLPLHTRHNLARLPLAIHRRDRGDRRDNQTSLSVLRVLCGEIQLSDRDSTILRLAVASLILDSALPLQLKPPLQPPTVGPVGLLLIEPGFHADALDSPKILQDKMHRNLREGSAGGYFNNARISSLSSSDNTLIARLMIRRADRPAPCA